MYCQGCGKEISDTVKFCPYCGFAATSESAAAAEPAAAAPQPAATVKKSKSKKIRNVLAVIGAFILLFVGYSIATYDSDVAIVKTGHFTFNQTVTVGDAFENFFADTEWESSQQNGEHLVIFKGKSRNTEDGGTNNFRAVFTVNPDTKTFQAKSVFIDGRKVDGIDYSIMKQICDGQKVIHYREI